MATSAASALTHVRERLDELDAAQWSDATIYRWMNEAAKNIARQTHIYMDTDTINVVADTSEYTLPEDVLRVRHVYYSPTGDSNRAIPLEARDWGAMDSVWGDRQNDNSSNYPACYTIIGYSPNATLKLWPVPSNGGSLVVHSARLPAEIDPATGGGNVDIPTGWEDIIYEYVEYSALRKDRDARWQEAKTLYEEKLGSLMEMGEILNAPNEFTPSHLGGMVPSWLSDY